jgi:putative hydrolase of the HAD superfamily
LSIDAVLLDWGHTLFDTPGSVDFILAFAESSSVDIGRDEIHALWDDARMSSRSASEIAKGRDKSATLHRQCWMALWQELEARLPGVSEALYEFETSAAGWSPYVDTPGVLQALSDRQIPVVIVSDVAFDLRPILRHYHLDHFIHTFVLSGEHGTIKPELRLFAIALDAVDVTADRALMVGDNHINDGAAIDVGIRTLLLAPNGVGMPRGLQMIVDIVDSQA